MVRGFQVDSTCSHAGTCWCWETEKLYHIVALWFNEVVKDHAIYRYYIIRLILISQSLFYTLHVDFYHKIHGKVPIIMIFIHWHTIMSKNMVKGTILLHAFTNGFREWIRTIKNRPCIMWMQLFGKVVILGPNSFTQSKIITKHQLNFSYQLYNLVIRVKLYAIYTSDY